MITVNGGTFQYIAGGNQRCAAQAPLGVYSGNMTLNIGGSARVTGSSYTGVCGMNYLTGTISANISSWGDVVLCDYAKIGTLTDVEFKCTRNTGKITINVADGVKASVIVTGDFNGDGALTLADALMMLRYVVNGFDPDKASVFFDNTDVSLIHVLYVLCQIAP